MAPGLVNETIMDQGSDEVTYAKEPANTTSKLAEVSAMKTKGQSASTSVPPGGVWAPAITFFDHQTDDLSLEPQAKYYSYLSKSGLAGLVILGTNAETFLLTQSER